MKQPAGLALAFGVRRSAFGVRCFLLFHPSTTPTLEFPEDKDEEEKRGNWRRRMGIEPTWDFVEPHTGFEDQERHQVALHLHPGSRRRLPMTGVIHFRQAALQLHLDRLGK